MDSVAQFFLSPSVIVAIIFGASAALLLYILGLFNSYHGGDSQRGPSQEKAPAKEKREPVAGGHQGPITGKSRKKAAASSSGGGGGDSKFKDRAQFNSPWLLTTLKGHTGQVLQIDFSANEKFLASCAEDEAEDEASPKQTQLKKLSRRQKKNRKRDVTSTPSARKKSNTTKLIMASANDAEECCCDLITTLGKPLKITYQDFSDYLHHYLLSEEQLVASGYPFECADNKQVMFYGGRFPVNRHKIYVPDSSSNSSSGSNSNSNSDGDLSDDSSDKQLSNNNYYTEAKERLCCRCGKGFFITDREYLTQEACYYHWGKALAPIPGSKKRYNCCQRALGSPGCTAHFLHVWGGSTNGLNGPCPLYQKTKAPKLLKPNGDYGVYALDCEMSYTIAGLELTKVTILSIDGSTVYETYVRPENDIVDFNTRFSGIGPYHLRESNTKTLKQVQSDLRILINSATILIGHGLENDLRALKLVHYAVIDTALLFTHPKGFPFRYSLKSLTEMYLMRQIQGGDSGHDSYEDARACLDLVQWKVCNDFRAFI